MVSAGLDPAAVEELRTGGEPTYARAEAALGTHAVVELVGVLGYYQLISITIKAFRVGVPPHAAEPSASPDGG